MLSAEDNLGVPMLSLDNLVKRQPWVQQLHQQLASTIAKKRGVPYSQMMQYIRTRLRFSLLRSILIAVRGYRGKVSERALPIGEVDFGLIEMENEE